VPAVLAGPLRIVVAIASPEAGGGPLLDYELLCTKQEDTLG
jgi:hypothetical protein